MVGNAVDTIVWSRAARSIPAISALNTVRISRWRNAGGWGLVAGTAFIGAPYNQYACGMQRTAVDQEVAERVRTAWRELRRVASTPEVRAAVYDPAAPLDPGQADALDAVVTHGPCRMSDIAVVLRVDRSSATRAVDRLEAAGLVARRADRSEEHKSELPSLMRISYAVFC